jgi:putative hemolysin
VLAVRAGEAPNVLREIGRLREVTFREVGEGTGKKTDIDAFDDYYWHLVLWNKAKREIVGAYRAGNSEKIISRFGVKGLYTSTLFKYEEQLFQKIGPALELGRSFVRAEYQRQYAPLLLLWKGIARFVATNPETPLLFGAVSISNNYNRTSRELIVRYFESKRTDNDLARLIHPRKPFRTAPTLRTWDWQAMCKVLGDLNQLAEPISDMEVDGKGLPILLKQYAKVGGELVGFNVDRYFSNVLDGLVVVDLRRTERSTLERYMGRDGLAKFYGHHGIGDEVRGKESSSIQTSAFLCS